MRGQLQKAIKLAKKTGDRLIVFDSAHTEDIYVVMSLDEYEKLVIGRSEVKGLTEEELLDKINRDIAIWKSEQDFWEDKGKKDNDYFVDEVADTRGDGYGRFSREEENRDNRGNGTHVESRGRRELKHVSPPPRPAANNNKKNPWAIPRARKEAAEEIIEEDKQYLEEVN